MCCKLSRFFALVWLFSLAACSKDAPVVEPTQNVTSGNSVFVLNEGNYQSGNASVTALNLLTDEVTEDMFQLSNHRPVGDVLQSIALVNGEGWLVVNNSQKIERVDLKTMKAAEPITGFHSPRFALEISATKAYVTDLYANKIHIVNPASGIITGHISCYGWTEQLIPVGNEVWVCNVKRNKIYTIDPTIDSITDSISVGDEPNSLVLDAEQTVWVVCGGKIPPNETAGSLWKIDVQTKSAVKTLLFPSTTIHPSRLKLNASKTALYYIYHGIYKMQLTDTLLPANAFIAAGSHLYYGMDIRNQDNSIWISDAKDYMQKGVVLRYSETGELIKTYSVGYIPNAFYFY